MLVQGRQTIAEILQGVMFTTFAKVAKVNIIKNHLKFNMKE